MKDPVLEFYAEYDWFNRKPKLKGQNMAKKQPKEQGIWGALWEQYKMEWKQLWNEYKSLIIPFIEGTAKYIWQLVYGLIELVAKVLFLTGKYYIKKLIEIIKKA